MHITMHFDFENKKQRNVFRCPLKQIRGYTENVMAYYEDTFTLLP